MELVPIPECKVTLAIGLDRWTSLNPLDSLHSQIVAWQGDGFDFAATYRAGAGTVYGLVHAGEVMSRTEPTRGIRLLALAACVALVKALRGRNAFVAFRLHDDLVAVTGLRHGVVVLDQLVSAYALAQVRKTFEQHLGGQDYDTWGDTPKLAEAAHPLALEEVIPRRAGPQIEALRSPRATRAAIAVVSACLVLGALGYAYTEFRQRSELARQQQLLLLRDSAPTQYRRAIAQLLARPVVPLAGALRAFRDELSAAALYHAGWELHGATCASSGLCTLKYQRLAGIGLAFREFAARPEPGWQNVASSGEDEAVVSIRVQVPTALLQRGSWPGAAQFQARNRSQWQFLEPGGWRATMGSRVIQAVPAGIEAKDVSALSALPEAVFAIPITVASQAWWYLDDDVDSPVQPDFIGEDTVMDGDLEMVVSGRDVTFSVKGLSYVQ